ncbi:hypothetical protein PIB30_091360 [Stylosanthes scabra]|uniref:Uncharacterized protein n=1 Tax=Stylosanthes scabra TaxID=79078 RepID=A0ABU6VUR5_9FABA|nr:hypothetical protein [Stylosanthes scabra]
MLCRRARKRVMGLQNYKAIYNRINALPTHLRNRSNDPIKNHRKNNSISAYNPEGNESDRKIEADLISKIREEARIKQQVAKELLTTRYNKKMKKRDLEEGDLVLQKADVGGKM